MSRRLIGKVNVMSNKLRSFITVLVSIVVVMAALPLNALKVNADAYNIIYQNDMTNESKSSATNGNGEATTGHAGGGDFLRLYEYLQHGL